MKQKSVAKNAILNIIRTFISLFFPLITFPYASRILMPEGIGKVNFSLSIVSYFSMIASLGISTYGIKEVAKVRDNKQLLSQITKEILLINLISTASAYLMLFAFIGCVSKVHPYALLIIIASISIFFTTLSMEWFYIAIEDFTYITIRSIVIQIISLFLLFIFVKKQDDYLKYAAITVFSSVGSGLLNILHSKKYIKYIYPYRSNLRKHIKPIFVFFALAMTTKIYTALDTTMLGFIGGDWQVGIYSAATKINRIVLQLVVSFGVVLLPRLSLYRAEDRKKEFESLVNKSFDILLLIALPCAIGLTVLAKQIILLLSGQQYIEATLSMRIMNPIIILIGISNFLGIQLFMPLGKEKWTLLSVILGALLNFIFNIILIPQYFVVGASISTIIAETSVTFCQLFLARKVLNLNLILKNFIKYAFSAILMAIPVYFISSVFNQVFISILVSVFSGMIIYLLVLIVQKNELVFILFKQIRRILLNEKI